MAREVSFKFKHEVQKKKADKKIITKKSILPKAVGLIETYGPLVFLIALAVGGIFTVVVYMV